MHVLNYCLFLYFRHDLNKRQNFNNTTTCWCQLDFFNIFLSIFSHLNSINFLFLNFIIRWSILGSNFLSKSLCIYNDIKKVIQYFWIVILYSLFQLQFVNICSDQSSDFENLRIFSTNYIIIVKKILNETQQNINV